MQRNLLQTGTFAARERSLNLSTISIAAALAAGAGGFAVDLWGTGAVCLGGIVLVLAALPIWLVTSHRRS